MIIPFLDLIPRIIIIPFLDLKPRIVPFLDLKPRIVPLLSYFVYFLVQIWRWSPAIDRKHSACKRMYGVFNSYSSGRKQTWSPQSTFKGPWVHWAFFVLFVTTVTQLAQHTCSGYSNLKFTWITGWLKTSEIWCHLEHLNQILKWV